MLPSFTVPSLPWLRPAKELRFEKVFVVGAPLSMPIDCSICQMPFKEPPRLRSPRKPR